MAQGYGDALNISVTVGGRASNNVSFAYDPPIIQGVVSNTPDANGAALVFRGACAAPPVEWRTPLPSPLLIMPHSSTPAKYVVPRARPMHIAGKNFGVTDTPVSVMVGNLSCLAPTWQNDRQLTCVTQRDVVGYKNVSLLGAGRSSPVLIFDFQQLFVALCTPGFYGLQGQLCTACPVGATCPGSELTTPLVTAQAGYWLDTDGSLTPASFPCPGGPECAYTVACAPAESCLGKNLCAMGYTGKRCSLCADGYYRVNVACEACPSSPYAIIVIFVLLAVLALCASYLLNKYKIQLTLIAVGIDYAQVRPGEAGGV